ncbi:unnamed protein product [Meloidogyne enterolobii]|uniref:Uncharacterized protein n=1 Tax=Meloidogyne enterolobii TaxID=390850 RepID=A0ACB0Z0Y3_MELEN
MNFYFFCLFILFFYVFSFFLCCYFVCCHRPRTAGCFPSFFPFFFSFKWVKDRRKIIKY